jgi:hypothetical protein
LCFLKKALMMGHAYNEPRGVWLVKLTRHVAAAPLAGRTPAEGATSVIKSIFRLTPLALAALGAACSEGSTTTSSASASSTGGVSGRIPELHREVAAECTAERPAANAGEPGGMCDADADCTQGANGRCVSPFPEPTPFCSYDECSTDADCGSTQVCDCRNPPNYKANTCFHGNCQRDADCGVGGFCSPSAVAIFSNCTETISHGSFGYFCHTESDECLDDSDCPGPGTTACIFRVEEIRWVCVSLICTK